MGRRRLRRSILGLNADSECYSRALSDETRSGPRIATFLGSDFFGPRLAEFHPCKLCCQAVKMARALASPALLLSAHLGPCTGACVPCARGPELLCLGLAPNLLISVGPELTPPRRQSLSGLDNVTCSASALRPLPRCAVNKVPAAARLPPCPRCLPLHALRSD